MSRALSTGRPEKMLLDAKGDPIQHIQSEFSSAALGWDPTNSMDSGRTFTGGGTVTQAVNLTGNALIFVQLWEHGAVTGDLSVHYLITELGTTVTTSHPILTVSNRSFSSSHGKYHTFKVPPGVNWQLKCLAVLTAGTIRLRVGRLF